MNEVTNRAKIVGAARRSLLDSGIVFWCQRDSLPIDAAIDAIDAARQAADMETYNDAINEAFWKNPHKFRRVMEKALNERVDGSALLDMIDGEFEWALTEALAEFPNLDDMENRARAEWDRRATA